MSRLALGVDPGGTTGAVVMDLSTGEVPTWLEERDQQKFLTWTWELLLEQMVWDVVIERWVTVKGRPMTFEPAAQEIIGALVWQAKYTGASVHMQGAADAKAFGGAHLLEPYKHVGRGGGGHAKMALRHLLLHRAVRGSLT